MRLIERSREFAEIGFSERELVALNNALALALVRCDEQDMEILSGSSAAEMKKLQSALSSMVSRDSGRASERGVESARRHEWHFFSAVCLRADEEEMVVRLGTSALLALGNSLTIVRGWLGPGDAKTLLLCDDDELLSLLRDIRTLATHPKRAARRRPDTR